MKVSTHINRSTRRMAVLSVALFACAVPAQAAAGAQIYRLHGQPESVPLVTDNSKAGTTDTVRVFRLHSWPQSVPLVTDNSKGGTTDTARVFSLHSGVQSVPLVTDNSGILGSQKATTSTTFDWRDTGIGLAAFSAIMVLGLAGMTAKRRRGALA